VNCRFGSTAVSVLCYSRCVAVRLKVLSASVTMSSECGVLCPLGRETVRGRVGGMCEWSKAHQM